MIGDMAHKYRNRNKEFTMANHLVIVESPAKVKTIKKFLGSNYEVDASGGHVRDLPKSQLGFDPEHDYEPKYITIRGKGDVLAKLRKEVKKADKIYLATDPDREGEAISWHLMKALKLDELKNKQVYRISFNEITKNAVKASLKSPRDLDMNLVNAQQTRRMLDRMVGYRISPLLWAKVKRGLSAGRVQSVALRMICDREDEINAFIPEEYWNLDAMLNVAGSKKPLDAKYYGLANEKGAKGSKSAIHSKEELDVILKDLEGVSYVADEVKKGERIKKAPIPFTTSTLQQEASKALNFSTQKTMRIAQQLYEGVEVKGHGTIGLITYLRTDSTRVADEADAAARSFVKEHYGENYAAAGEALTALQTAHDRLVKLNPDPQPGDVDKSGLTTLYNQYKDTKADGYTAESWTAFNEALMKAQSVLANPNATQDEVNAAKEALQTAYDGLVKDTTPDPNPNPNPDGNGGSGGNSGSNGNSGNSGNSGSNGSNGNGGNAAVVTGDSANIAGYLMALVAAGGIAVVTFFRRKRVK